MNKSTNRPGKSALCFLLILGFGFGIAPLSVLGAADGHHTPKANKVRPHQSAIHKVPAVQSTVLKQRAATGGAGAGKITPSFHKQNDSTSPKQQ